LSAARIGFNGYVIERLTDAVENLSNGVRSGQGEGQNDEGNENCNECVVFHFAATFAVFV
jgi:hypothetical protein